MIMGTENINPQFGQVLRMIYASDDNPHKYGFYVETIVRRGKLNPGVCYRMTNGKGDFWECESKLCSIENNRSFF